jgi:hypothetical protein
VTKPIGACGSLKSKVFEWEFDVVNGSQEHKKVLGSANEFALTAQTKGGSKVAFPEERSYTLESKEETTITCSNP